MSLETCGNSYEEWNAHGCMLRFGVFNQCDQCAEWEADHWDAVER